MVLLVLGVGLAILVALLALVASVLALTGRGMPATVVSLAWLLPLVVVVLGARWITHSAVHAAIADQAWHGWMPPVLSAALPSWRAVIWTGLTLAALGVLPALLGAIAGLMRGPRRVWLSVGAAVWSVVGVVSVALAALAAAQDVGASVFLLPAGVLVLGAPVALACLAGDPKVGPSAAEVTCASAAASLVGLVVYVTAQVQVDAVVLWASASSGGPHGPSLLGLSVSQVGWAGLIASVVAVGWVGLGLGARSHPVARWSGPVATVVVAGGLPLLVVGVDMTSPLAQIDVARSRLGPVELPADLELPLVQGDYAQALPPNPPRLVVTPSSVLWLSPGFDPRSIEEPLDTDALRDLVVEEGSALPPVLVDSRVPAERAFAVLQALASRGAGHDSVLVGVVREEGALDSRTLYGIELLPTEQELEPSLVVDRALVQAANCSESGACSPQTLRRVLAPLRSYEPLTFAPDLPFAYVPSFIEAHTTGAPPSCTVARAPE